MNLKELIESQTALLANPVIQTTPVKTSKVEYNLGNIVGESNMVNYTDRLMSTGIIGFNEPNPVFVSGLPTTPTVYGSSVIRQNDATTKGACNK